MKCPFREILDGSTFALHPRKEGPLEVLMRTRNGFYKKQHSEQEFEIDPSTMVELFTSPGAPEKMSPKGFDHHGNKPRKT